MAEDFDVEALLEAAVDGERVSVKCFFFSPILNAKFLVRGKLIYQAKKKDSSFLPFQSSLYYIFPIKLLFGVSLIFTKQTRNKK